MRRANLVKLAVGLWLLRWAAQELVGRTRAATGSAPGRRRGTRAPAGLDARPVRKGPAPSEVM